MPFQAAPHFAPREIEPSQNGCVPKSHQRGDSGRASLVT